MNTMEIIEKLAV